jgi:hypothetical protein
LFSVFGQIDPIFCFWAESVCISLGHCAGIMHKSELRALVNSNRIPAHSGGHFLHRDTVAAMKKITSTTAKTIRPMVSVSQSDANEAGKVVLRSCCVEPFVVPGKALELLSPACSAAQHGSAGRTKRRSRQAID